MLIPRICVISHAHTTDMCYITCFILQVQLVQAVVDGVNLLVEMEKRLEKGRRIDDLIPKK